MKKLNDYMEMARRSTYGAMGSRVPRQYNMTIFQKSTFANEILDNWKSFTNMIGRKNPITERFYNDIMDLADAIPDIIAEMNQIKHELDERISAAGKEPGHWHPTDTEKPESAF